jgi:hypothetical protein
MGAVLNDINVKYFELVIPASNRGIRRSQDYNAKCPICGDSKRNKLSKRFHLYTKTSFDGDVLKCFNGDCEYSGNMYSFLRDYHPSLLNSYIQEMKGEKINFIQEFLKGEEPQIDTYIPDSLFVPKIITDVPEIFQKITKGSYAYDYLIKRNIPETLHKYFLEVVPPFVFKEDDKEKNLENFIIIPLYYGKKIYGFTSRSTINKDFYTRIPEENTGWKVWNLLNVDLSKTLYIFEGTFDALSIESDNVVACLGADFPDEILKKVKDPVFVYDNTNIDKTGAKKAFKYAKLGYKVMIWPDISYKDFNAILTKGATREKLQKFLESNIYQGLSAQVRLKMEG